MTFIASLRWNLERIFEAIEPRHRPRGYTLGLDATTAPLDPETWRHDDGVLLHARATSHASKWFKPEKLVVTELVSATLAYRPTPEEQAKLTELRVAVDTLSGQHPPRYEVVEKPISVYSAPPLATDLYLIQAMIGPTGCFPGAREGGMSCAVFAANSLGGDLAWPFVAPGEQVNLVFHAQPSVFAQIDVPPQYDLRTVTVAVKALLYGELSDAGPRSPNLIERFLTRAVTYGLAIAHR